MKAHINGITVEGTPQEIMEYQRMQAQQKWMQKTSGGTTLIIDEDGFYKLSSW